MTKKKYEAEIQEERMEQSQSLSDFLLVVQQVFDYNDPKDVADIILRIIGNVLERQAELGKQLASVEDELTAQSINQEITELSKLLALHVQPLGFVPDIQAFVCVTALAMNAPPDMGTIDFHKALVNTIATWLQNFGTKHFADAFSQPDDE